MKFFKVIGLLQFIVFYLKNQINLFVFLKKEAFIKDVTKTFRFSNGGDAVVTFQRRRRRRYLPTAETPSLPLIQIWLGAPKDGHTAGDVAGNVFDAKGVARLFQFAVAGGE